MIETQLSILDAMVITIFVLSCLFAFFRGFVREVLSLSAWVGAGVVTIYYFPSVTETISPHFKSDTAAAGISTLGIYSISLLCFTIINAFILKYLRQGSEVGMIDNMLGLLFGGMRGYIIIALSFFLFSIFVPEERYPKWVVEAQTYPYVLKSAAYLASVAPEYLQDISDLDEKVKEQNKVSQVVDLIIDDRESGKKEPEPNSPSKAESQQFNNRKNQDLYNAAPYANTAPSAGSRTNGSSENSSAFKGIDEKFDTYYGN